MPNVPWSIRGPHMVNCNCDYGCPCQFNALPTDGTCRAVAAWRIDEGYFGEVRLDGLCMVNTYSWPGAIHQGNGEMQSIIDERADDAQRAALAAILQGEGAPAGTVMLQIYRAMCSKLHPPLVKPIVMEFDLEGRTATLTVPGVLRTAIEPIKNPVTGAAHRARIDLPLGKEFNFAEVASGTTEATGAVALELKKSHAHLVHNRMSSTGVSPN
jgi:hypothetical protein